MRNPHLPKRSLAYLLPCFSGLAFITSANAQTNHDESWQRMMNDFQKAMAQTNAAAPTPTINDLNWQRMMIERARTNTSAMSAADLSATTPAGNDNASRFFTFHKVTADDDWTRHFRIGAIVGLNIKANFKENGIFNLNGNGPANGTYDDGYVREDQTGNAGGYTGYWGYNNASQYNAAQQTLTLHQTTSYSTSGSSSDSGEPFPGFELAYGGNLFYWQRVRVGWELGFDLLPMSFTDNQSMSASVIQKNYIFDTSGIVMPGAPYHGGASGVGEPLLPDSPNYTTQNPPTSGTVSGSRKLDAMLYAIRLGPSFYWDISENLGLSAGIGPTIGVVSAEYKFDEIVTTGGGNSHNVGSFSSTDVIFGGNLNATLLYHTVDNGRPVDLYISAEYAPMESAVFSSGGREGKINLQGQVYFSAGINWAF